MSLILRYMTMGDVPQVITIDRLSFDPPWSARSYAYEVSESTYSHMVVLEQTVEVAPATGLRRLVKNLSGAQQAERQIVAYGGLWHIADEAHISTIATHPAERGRGYGEIVLAGMVRRALTLNAAYVVLEVRVSNTAAQNLYRKHDFQITDVKPRYYHNNGEDAYDMRLMLTDPVMKQRIEERYASLRAQHRFIDQYTDVPPPRGQT
ncbi:MAG: ribosomal protein S18-alanine N-acetyltransferase [Chloroflexota bacterium]|nr:MAG: ribosomal-protein-alanine N-acetyltransferase [Chloroflexota bacterium]